MYVHTYIHAYIRTYVRVHTYVHTYIRTYIHTYVHTYVHTDTVIMLFVSHCSDLAFNALTHLPASIFQGLYDLDTVFVSSLCLIVLSRTDLHDRSLYTNQITSLPSGLFSNLPSLSNVFASKSLFYNGKLI